MRSPSYRRSIRARGGCRSIEMLEERVLLSVAANDATVNALENVAASIALRPFVDDSATSPSLTFAVGAPSQGGTISNFNAAQGTFTYTPPNPTFLGIDTVSYTATDTTTNESGTGTLTIDIEQVAAALVSVPVLQGKLADVNLAGTVTDVLSHPTLSFSIPASSAQGGAITNINTAQGTFTYMPPSASFTGGDSVSYTVTDTASNASSTSTVLFYVAPLIADSVSAVDLEGASKTITLAPSVQDVTTNAVLSFAIPAASSQGGAIINVDATTGSFTYAPPTSTFTGTDTVTYSVTDTVTHATATAVVTIHIAPIVADPVYVSDLRGATKTIHLALAIEDVTTKPTLQFQIPASSADGGTVSNVDTSQGTFSYTPPSATFVGDDSLSYTVTDTATGASASGTVLINVATLIANPASADDLDGTTRTIDLGPVVQDVTTTPTLEFELPAKSAEGGAITGVNATTGSFSYAPPSAAFQGSDTITYTVVDTATNASATGLVTIDVQPLFADALSVAATENTPKAVDLASGVHDATAFPLLQYTIPSKTTQGGVISDVSTTDGIFVYTPPSPSFVGTDTLTYTVVDTTTHDSASGLVTITVSKPTLKVSATSPADGSFVTALPNGKVVITFNHPLLASTLYKVGSQTTGLLASDPYSVFLVARGPSGVFSAPSANSYEGGDLPIHANTTYSVNANGTSQITIVPTDPLAPDVYAISISGNYVGTTGDTLAAGTGVGRYYTTFLYQPPPPTTSPLQVTGVTAFNNYETIANNLIYQPDTIAIHFNRPLFASATNGNTVQLLAKEGTSVVVVPSVAAYSPTTDSIALTPTAVLSPGTLYIIRVAGKDSGSSYISDDQGFGLPGNPLATTFFDSFTVRNEGVGAGHAPLEVATTNGNPATYPASGVIWTQPFGYASITFTEPLALSSFGRYSAMLIPAAGGLNPTGFDVADVPLNAILAFNPNLNELIIVPTQWVGNDLYLFALSAIDAAGPNGQANPSDPLLNNSGKPAGVGNPPYYASFEFDASA